MGRSDQHQRRKAVDGNTAGQNAHTGEILASAMRHSVGRPAMGMGGGTLDLWSGSQPPSALPLNVRCKTEKSAPLNGADFVVSRRHQSEGSENRSYRFFC